MKRPKNKTFTPKNGFRYKQPQTGMEFVADHPNVLEKQVFDHRMSLPDMNLDLGGGWKSRMWHDACEQNSLWDCEDTEDPGRYPNLIDAWNWVQSMNDWRARGFDTVTQEVAESRAAICAECPRNRNVSGCMGCHGVAEVVSRLTGGKTTSKDGLLSMCEVCLCVLAPKVHLPIEVLHPEKHEGKWPSHCWMIQESSN
jgi:hypothetical protein